MILGKHMRPTSVRRKLQPRILYPNRQVGDEAKRTGTQTIRATGSWTQRSPWADIDRIEFLPELMI
jgi:hypothetical protein